jgi:excisionase family DNA binding protein
MAPGKGRAIMAVAESRPEVPAVLYDVDEAAEALRLRRSVLYELIRPGRLRTVKQGRRRLVPVSALAEYVDSLGGRA